MYLFRTQIAGNRRNRNRTLGWLYGQWLRCFIRRKFDEGKVCNLLLLIVFVDFKIIRSKSGDDLAVLVQHGGINLNQRSRDSYDIFLDSWTRGWNWTLRTLSWNLRRRGDWE